MTQNILRHRYPSVSKHVSSPGASLNAIHFVDIELGGYSGQRQIVPGPYRLFMPGEGLEPTRIAPEDFKSSASASSATPAGVILLLHGFWFNYWSDCDHGGHLMSIPAGSIMKSERVLNLI